jgi:hypothetical protein
MTKKKITPLTKPYEKGNYIQMENRAIIVRVVKSQYIE